MINLFSVSSLTMKNRNIRYDLLKSGAMILVIIQHCGCYSGKYILGFHMPLFFALSGYLYSWKKDSFEISCKEHILKKILRLILPYFSFEIFALLISIMLIPIFHYNIDMIAVVKSVLLCINNDNYQGVLLRIWFFPCLFVADTLFYLWGKIVKNNFWLLTLFSLVLSWCSYTLIKVRLPFTIDISFMALVFFAIGFKCGFFVDFLIDKTTSVVKIILFAVSAAGLFLCVHNNSSPVYMYLNEYGDYWIGFLGALIGCIMYIALYALCESFLRPIKILTWISNNSLILFPIHCIYVGVVKRCLFKILGIDIWFITFIIVMLLSIPTVNFISRYMPFMTGDINKKEK